MILTPCSRALSWRASHWENASVLDVLFFVQVTSEFLALRLEDGRFPFRIPSGHADQSVPLVRAMAEKRA